MDWGQLDVAYLLQLTGWNIELDATISSLSSVAAIKQDYWAHRPELPTDKEFQEVRGDLHFADTVDKVVAIQRGMRLKDAWVWTMNIVTNEGNEAVSEQWLSEVPYTVKNVMGAWINGTKENEVYWLLKHRIPCFIIHEISASELYLHWEDHKSSDFVAQTDTIYLIQEHNGFDNIAHRHKSLINARAGQEGIPPVLPVLSAKDRAGSNLQMQGWDGTKHRLLEETLEVLMKPYQPPTSMHTMPRNQAPSVDSTAEVPEPEVRSLAQERVEWLVPPMVMAASAGKWKFWKEDNLDRDTSCFCPVTKRLTDCERVCYDRVERRELFFIKNIEVPLGAVSDINLFGFLAPEARFVEITDGVITKEYTVSHWLYTKPEARRGTVGLRAPTPPSSDLPLRSTLCKGHDKLPLQISKPSPSRPTSFPSPLPATQMSTLSSQKPIPTELHAHHQ